MTPFPPPRGAGCPPHVHLERASTGDFEPGVQAHLAHCEACTAHFTAMAQARAAFLAARPTDRFVAQVLARRATPPPRRWGVVFALAAGVCAVAVLLALPKTPPPVTLKGALTRISIKRAEQVLPAKPGTPLQPGDALRFSVNAPSAGFAVVLERDGRGQVTVVAPFGAKAAWPVPPGAADLPDSAVLDDVRGTERFVTVFSARPFDVDVVRAQLQGGEAVGCDGCQVESVSFDKP